MNVTTGLSPCIALLRGINVGGRNRVPMAELRSLAAGLGWVDLRTYIQSGNLVFRAAAQPPELAGELEQAIERAFGLSVPVIVRTAAEWTGFLATNPFPDASRTEPNRVMLALSKLPPKDDAEGRLRERAASGERIRRVDDVLWIHYAGGAGRSKLSPGLLDRVVGSPVTTRNWRTARHLAELAGESWSPDLGA